MSDDISDLIRELAVEHGVALDRSDPILVLQTATRRILQNALAQAQAAQATALQQHRAELELVSAKWREDSKRSASQLLDQVGAAIGASVERELNQSAANMTAQLGQAFARHDKALARSTLTCALSAAVVVLAVAALVWAIDHASERPAAHGQIDISVPGAVAGGSTGGSGSHPERACRPATPRPWNAAPRGEGARRALPDGEGRRVPPLATRAGAGAPDHAQRDQEESQTRTRHPWRFEGGTRCSS